MTIYTMLAVAVIEAPDAEEAERIMVSATPGLAGRPDLQCQVAMVAEGDWTMPLTAASMDFLNEARGTLR